MGGSSKCDVYIESSESTNEAIPENMSDCSAKVTAQNATAGKTTDNSSNGTASHAYVKQTEQSTVRAALLSVLAVATYEFRRTYDKYVPQLQVSRLQMKLS